MCVKKGGGYMAAAPFEKQSPDVVKKAPERVKKLTFRQAVVLTASIIVLGGLPGAICTLGSVRTPPPQTYSSEQAAVMSNTDQAHLEACVAPVSTDDAKPTMNAQNKGKE